MNDSTRRLRSACEDGWPLYLQNLSVASLLPMMTVLLGTGVRLALFIPSGRLTLGAVDGSGTSVCHQRARG